MSIIEGMKKAALPTPTAPTITTTPYPTLRAGMILYLLVLIGTTLITLGFSGNVETSFLRLVTAVFLCAGLTLLAMLLTRVPADTLYGARPTVRFLLSGLVAGLAIYVFASWLYLFLSRLFGGLFGNLPAPLRIQGAGATEIALFGQITLFALILPLCYGILFYGFLYHGARGLGRWRAVLFVALLYGIFGIFAGGQGLTAGPSYFFVGLAAGAFALRSGSGLAAVCVLAGFNLGDPILSGVLGGALRRAGNDVLGFELLTLAALSAFLTVVLVQVARLTATPTRAWRPAAPGRLWWLLWIPIALLVVFYGASEIRVRQIERARAAAPILPGSGSTLPPAVPTATPIAAPPR